MVHLGGSILSLVFLAIFAAALVVQSAAGWHDFNNEQLRHHSATISYGRYLVTSGSGGHA